MDATRPTDPLDNSTTAAQLLHALARFGRVLRFRWPLITAALTGILLLGGLYYFTADRSYRARAQLLVQQTGPVMNGMMNEAGAQQGMLPTYERLFSSTVVLEGALQRLQEQPRALRSQLFRASRPLSRQALIASLRERLGVKSFRLTNVIEVSFTASSPEAAEVVVKAVVDSYLDFMKENHKTVAEELVTILRSERRDVERMLLEKERALVEAKRKFGDMGLRDSTQTLHPLVQRVVKINETLIGVQENRLKLQASQAAVEAAIAQGADLRQHLFSIEPVLGREVVLAALGLSDQDAATVARMEQELMTSQAELESLEPHLGARHPKVSQLEESIKQTRVYLANYQESVEDRAARLQSRQLGEMLRSLLGQELTKATAQEASLLKQYEAAQAAAVQLQGKFEEIAMLQREVDRLHNLNHTLLNRIDGIDINQNQADVRVEVVSRAEASRRPVSPNAVVVAATSLLFGLGAGAGLVYVVDVLDDRFRSLDEMKHQLQTPILAIVRQLEQHAPAGLASLQVHAAPDAVASEAFRTLRTTLAFAGEELECVAISSSEPGDGKTTVVANLGLSFAQAGKRTLLIDADLRRPGLTRLFELKSQPGLSDILRSELPIGASVNMGRYHLGRDGFDIIPSGPRPLDPTGLLGSRRFAELLAWAATQYDQVLIDSPPTLVASDATIVGRLAGGLMLVVQPQKNHRRLVMRAIEETRTAGLHLIGVIINKLTAEGGQAYYGDSYGYGYGYGEKYTEDEVEAAAASDVGATTESPIDVAPANPTWQAPRSTRQAA